MDERPPGSASPPASGEPAADAPAGSAGVPAPRRPAAPARQFTDEEVARILRSASELQERSASGSGGSGVGGGRGLTLEDLRQVAAEVGIDPRYVELAADRVHGPAEREHSPLIGTAYSWAIHRTVPGEVPEEDRDRIVRAIRGVIGQKGEIEDVYGRMEWSYDDGLGPIMVGVASRDGTTEIDVTGRRGGEAGLVFGMGVPMGGMALGGLLGGGLLGLEKPGVLLTMLVMAVVVYGGLRFVWRFVEAFWEDRLQRLTDAVEAAAAEVAVLPSGDPAEPPPEG